MPRYCSVGRCERDCRWPGSHPQNTENTRLASISVAKWSKVVSQCFITKMQSGKKTQHNDITHRSLKSNEKPVRWFDAMSPPSSLLASTEGSSKISTSDSATLQTSLIWLELGMIGEVVDEIHRTKRKSSWWFSTHLKNMSQFQIENWIISPSRGEH